METRQIPEYLEPNSIMINTDVGTYAQSRSYDPSEDQYYIQNSDTETVKAVYNYETNFITYA